MVGVDMYPMCIQYVSNVYPMCIQYVSNVYPMCSVSKVYSMWIQSVANGYPMSIKWVSNKKRKKNGGNFLGHKKNFWSKNVFGQKNL